MEQGCVNGQMANLFTYFSFQKDTMMVEVVANLQTERIDYFSVLRSQSHHSLQINLVET